ncbi:hypothetical protein MKX01_033379, partial [Papaver californicum]
SQLSYCPNAQAVHFPSLFGVPRKLNYSYAEIEKLIRHKKDLKVEFEQFMAALLTTSSAIEKSNAEALTMVDEGCEGVIESIERLSLAQRLSFLDDNQQDPLTSLLRACNQFAPSTLLDLFSQYCIEKLGEGTFGEVFRAGEIVCKIVPIDGDLVNGFVQKRSSELLKEVLLSRALNSLKGQEGDNTCTTFIETIDVRVCQGVYDASLIKAWEDWNVSHKWKTITQIFFKENRGNILLTRTGVETEKFVLEGKQMWARTFGLSISTIDFTLSGSIPVKQYRILTYLLIQLCSRVLKSETYRKMRKVTKECWEGSFPKTNVLWLQYLVDILLLKKSFSRTPEDKKNLHSLKKRLGRCCSAKEAIADPFFSA